MEFSKKILILILVWGITIFGIVIFQSDFFRDEAPSRAKKVMILGSDLSDG